MGGKWSVGDKLLVAATSGVATVAVAVAVAIPVVQHQDNMNRLDKLAKADAYVCHEANAGRTVAGGFTRDYDDAFVECTRPDGGKYVVHVPDFNAIVEAANLPDFRGEG